MLRQGVAECVIGDHLERASRCSFTFLLREGGNVPASRLPKATLLELTQNAFLTSIRYM
jgi:hypothetical protein